MKMYNNKGISMVTLVITIVVIIILSAISFVVNDSATERAQRAKKEAEISQETQILKTTLKNAENIFSGEIEKDELAEGLKEHHAIIDESYVSENPAKKEYKIIFNKTRNAYIIDKNGEITVLDKLYTDNETPSEPSTPGIPEGEEEYYMTVGGKNIEIIGDIANRVSESGGLLFTVGEAFSYNEGYYYVVGKQGGWVGNESEIPSFVNDRCVKLNVEKGFVTPGPDTVEGDMKLVGDKVYFYHPDDNRTDGYDIEAWWIEIPANQKPV
ncbi:MAG: hypothetical protein J6B87_01515 [Clostridia bacterium]|nr:hypothetical protein [Clostridia bacterium]